MTINQVIKRVRLTIVTRNRTTRPVLLSNGLLMIDGASTYNMGLGLCWNYVTLTNRMQNG